MDVYSDFTFATMFSRYTPSTSKYVGAMGRGRGNALSAVVG